MTEVIKKLKLGIIKHYTKGNLAQVPIQFTRPEVLIWRDINEEILIFFFLEDVGSLNVRMYYLHLTIKLRIFC